MPTYNAPSGETMLSLYNAWQEAVVQVEIKHGHRKEIEDLLRFGDDLAAIVFAMAQTKETTND